MNQPQQFPASQPEPTRSAAASVQRAPELAPIGSGAGVHHADGCGDEPVQGGEVTAW